MKRFVILIIGLLLYGSMVMAEIPSIINYQGRLTDTGGEPVADGPYSIIFNLYETAIGSDVLWSSGPVTVQVTNGLFNHQLGSASSMPSDLFGPGLEPYLGITVGADSEITPRTPIISSAYAWHANTAEIAQDISCYHCVSTDDIDDGCITSDKLVPGAVTATKIAVNAVSDDRISDEPGVAHSYLATFNFETSVETADSVVITVPSSGYVVISASAYFDFGFDLNGDFVKASISKTKGAIDDQNLAYFTCPNGSSVWQYKDNFSITIVDVVPSSGRYVYYLTTDENNDTILTESYLKHLHMTAVFYPTAYGDVDDYVKE